MTFRFCFCFKRHHASYDMSLDTVSHATSNSIASTVTSPPLPSLSDPAITLNDENIVPASDDGQNSINNEYTTPRTSTKSNSYGNTTPQQSTLVVLDDYSELYAKVDKTRKAKNSIRIEPDTSRTASTTTTPSRPRSWLNLRLSDFRIAPEHRPLSLPVNSNVPVNTRMSYHEDTSNRRHSRYDHVEPRVSLLYRTQRSLTEIGQTRPNFSRTSARESTDGSDSYAELDDNNSTSGTIPPNRRSHLYSQSSNNSKIDDDSSERYATISEVYISEDQSAPNNLSQRN